MVDDFKTCANCKFATVYIPYYAWRVLDPYCCKGHGLCGVDKSCSDFELLGRLCR